MRGHNILWIGNSFSQAWIRSRWGVLDRGLDYIKIRKMNFALCVRLSLFAGFV